MISVDQVVGVLEALKCKSGTCDDVFAGLKMKDIITVDVIAAVRQARDAGRVVITYDPKLRIDVLTLPVPSV